MDTQNYAERITLGQPHSVYTKVVKIFKERCLLRVQAWMHLFNGKFLILHYTLHMMVVRSQDSQSSAFQAGISDIMMINYSVRMALRQSGSMRKIINLPTKHQKYCIITVHTQIVNYCNKL